MPLALGMLAPALPFPSPPPSPSPLFSSLLLAHVQHMWGGGGRKEGEAGGGRRHRWPELGRRYRFCRFSDTPLSPPLRMLLLLADCVSTDATLSVLSGSSCTLPAGDYLFTDVLISGTVTALGNVTITAFTSFVITSSGAWCAGHLEEPLRAGVAECGFPVLALLVSVSVLLR